MKKKLVSGLALTILAGLVVFPSVSFAVEDKLDTDINANVTTGTGAGKTEEEISDKPGRDGTFVIKAASDFNFSAIPVGETRAATIGEGKALGIEVVDLTGEGTGWNVQAKLASLKITEGANKGEELKGWELMIPTKEITSKSSDLSENYKPKANNITLNSESAATVFYAEKGKGMGRYTNIFDRYEVGQKDTRETGVRLKVPNTARKGKYAGKMMWTLTNVPSTN